MPLATLSQTGKAPQRRLQSASDARDIFGVLFEAARPRMAVSARIQGLFDGNPPYNPSKVRNQAQAWRSNFNTLDGVSRLETAKTPYYDLFSSASQLSDCTTDVSGESVDAATASRIRSLYFDEMCQTFEDFHTEFGTMLNDFIAFNRGFLWWPHPESWHFQRLPWHKVLFPDGTPCRTKDWELFVIDHSWPVHKLWDFIKDEEAAAANGWNRKEVIRAITAAVPEELGDTYRDPMVLQKTLRDSGLWLSAKCAAVRAASVYVREFDGTWTRMMVSVEVSDSGKSSGPESPANRAERVAKKENSAKNDDWMMVKQKVATNINEIMAPFIFEVGDGSINEITGLGRKIISISQASDRLANSMVDSAMMASTIVLQAQTGAAQHKLGIVHFGGGVTTLPPGFAVQPGTIFGDINGALTVSTDLSNRLDKNTGVYRPQFEKPTGNPESATAANIRFSQATVLGSSAVNRFYNQLDPFYRELYRRATLRLPKTSSNPGIKAAREFQEKCEAAGLSKEQIEDNRAGLVRAMRTMGNGSPMMRQQQLAALGQMVPFMGPRGLKNYKVDYAAAFAGQQGAMRYFPAEDLHQEPTQADREAFSENNDAQTGAQPLFLESDDHAIHAKVHMTAALGAINSVQQGADPSMPYTFLQIMLSHIGQHIVKVPQVQTRKALEQAYKEIAAGAKVVEEAAQKQMQNQQQAMNLSFEQQLKMQEAQFDQQLKATKTQAQIEQRQQRQLADMRMKEESHKQDASLKDMVTAADVRRQTAQTVTTIELEKKKTEAAVNAQRAKAAAAAKSGASNAES